MCFARMKGIRLLSMNGLSIKKENACIISIRGAMLAKIFPRKTMFAAKGGIIFSQYGNRRTIAPIDFLRLESI